MKKLLTLLLALALVFSLAACGGSKTEEAKPAEEATPADAGPLADLIAAAKAEAARYNQQIAMYNADYSQWWNAYHAAHMPLHRETRFRF